jgi:predicted mannosyl-3-phosphoglycerate phosphatase (HAD superfamily)
MNKVVNCIKDVTKIKLRDYEVLTRVRKINSPIVLVNDKEGEEQFNQYLEVIKVGKTVSLVEVGDRIIMAERNRMVPFEHNGQTYIIIDENSARLVVSDDNFSASDELVN